MNEWIFLTIGFFIGGIIGVMSISLISVGKTTDLYREIEDLRIQRKLLRDELVKKQTKPTPRKYRKNKLNV
jgi:hypothetical protein|tara:strand:+ start:272 stop:484 length:213 start_codon:yes stop_codon:yes gene_type:complete